MVTGNPPQYFGRKRGDPKKTPTVFPKDVSAYAAAKARRLIVQQFEEAGCPQNAKQYENSKFATNPLIAFARYIDRME